MIRFLFLSFVLVFITFPGHAEGQNLLNERIRKITSRKKSIYLERGIFHNGNEMGASSLKKLRHSYSPKRGYERLVMDFSTSKIPKVYGYFSTDQKKLYIDLFKTDIGPNIGSFGNAHFVKGVNFLPLDKESLSMEVELKGKVALDIFYLENPGRLVIDLKK